jgi:hypothetical protein
MDISHIINELGEDREAWNANGVPAVTERSEGYERGKARNDALTKFPTLDKCPPK